MSRRLATTGIGFVSQITSTKLVPSTFSQCVPTKRTFASTSSTHSPAVAEVSSSSSSSLSSSSSPQEDDRRWQLFASVIIERPRIVVKERTHLEKEFQTMLDDYEHEKAMKSEHEVRVEQDILNMERKRKGLEIVNEPLQTGFEYEECRESLHNSFTPASRVTDSDDLSSMQRLMDEKVYLFVPHLLGSGEHWFLPSASVEGKSSLRKAADEALTKTLGGPGNALEVQVVGNAPVGFYKYRYPLKSQERQSFTGGKFFFFKAFIKDPRTFQMGGNEKHAWLSKAEMSGHLQRRFRTKITGCLFDY